MKSIIHGRYLLHSFLLLILSSGISAQNIALSEFERTSLFADDFNGNSNQWITDNNWISGKIEGGFYNIVCKNFQGSTGISPVVVKIDPGRDYEIEASYKIIKGSGALVFGMTNKFDHYRVELSDAGALSLFKDTPSKKKKLEKLFTGSGNFPLTDGFNKITIRQAGGVFQLLVNETPAGSFTNIKPEGNSLGFSVGLDSEISVDYLRVYIKSSGATDVTAVAVSQEAVLINQSAISSVTATIIPVIKWVSPSAERIELEVFTARVRASVNSATGLKSVLLYVNGVSKGEAEIIPTSDPNVFTVEKTINFGPGENSVYLVATNTNGSAKSDLRNFLNPLAVAPAVTWASPGSQNSVVNTESLSIGACINSSTELKSVKLLVNGMVQSEENVFQVAAPGDCNYNWNNNIILKEGDNNVYIIATNLAGSVTSEKRVIRLEPKMTERRLALVFGNSDYKKGTPLKNPVNDANLMEGTLRELGFDVIKRLNASRDEMMQSIREFNEKLPDYNVALFYYAGHGNQVDGKNYIIPSDALLEKSGDCRFEAIDMGFVIEEFEHYPDNTNIVILDACRNNPYTAWARGNDAGFRAMTFSSGTIVSFATSEGATAADGSGANGLFTEELVKQMMKPQSILNVFMNTRVQVRKLSNNAQVPTEWNKLNGDFFFRK